MKNRINYGKLLPEGLKLLNDLDEYARHSGLEASLLELIKLRASQLNGCAYCIDMHTKDARSGGETEQRLYTLSAWREAPFYTDRKRAALAFTEAVTLMPEQRARFEEVCEQARQHFSDQELVKLMLALVTINAWNRFTAFGDIPGNYKPRHFVTESRPAVPSAV